MSEEKVENKDENKNIDKREFTLNEKHLKVMELKFKGLTYGSISKELEIPIDTLKNWFRIGGVLSERYRDFSNEQLEEIEKDSRIHLRKALWNASAVIERALTEKVELKTTCPNPECKKEFTVSISIPTFTRLRAAVEVLDRVMGKSVQPLELSGEIKTNYDELELDEINKRIEELERGGTAQDVENGEVKETPKEIGV